MYRPALRSTSSAVRAIRPTTALGPCGRRFASTGPAGTKKGTWKGAAARWALAAGAVYFYNTSPIFADDFVQTAPAAFADSDLPTIDALVEEKRRQTLVAPPRPPAPAQRTKQVEAEIEKVVKEEEGSKVAKQKTSSPDAGAAPAAGPPPEPGSPEALEQEASQQGAFNPETGEINWDCPCLGGMAHGPCGEDFKAAFSCFVYSKEEPKGIECIEKFQNMQTCFRQYPDIYGSELADEEDDETPGGDAVADPALVKAIDSKSKEQKTEELRELSIGSLFLPVSYAEIAAKGPKQTPEEAAAPRPPQIEVADVASESTGSLVDVDGPSVRTVPADFEQQAIKTETQANRIEMEHEEARRERERKHAEEKARAEADLAKKKAKKADRWMTGKFEQAEGTPAGGAIALGNLLAVVGISGWLGFRAWGLYDKGRLGWKEVGLGLGILSAVGVVEGVFANYLYKAKEEKNKKKNQ
ncbi:mitochondrial intermembrane space import and assembly protein 40 [Cladorrhinum samala]|uniref:Mitochondrial intermembrane space import and assembly protein 40 n=1 Tax=Cladorrhinum samala TaxID=585594 RepID=A0AAV9HX86_9PEZI|nr:mitochondrial intermembrane space import and assembly protein 40 [Cladorrhinum samala]